MTPFEEFFDGQWADYVKALDKYDSGPVFSSGHTINNSSWDRKAAFLLWLIINDMPPPELETDDD